MSIEYGPKLLNVCTIHGEFLNGIYRRRSLRLDAGREAYERSRADAFPPGQVSRIAQTGQMSNSMPRV
mgnify:FL=1